MRVQLGRSAPMTAPNSERSDFAGDALSARPRNLSSVFRAFCCIRPRAIGAAGLRRFPNVCAGGSRGRRTRRSPSRAESATKRSGHGFSVCAQWNVPGSALQFEGGGAEETFGLASSLRHAGSRVVESDSRGLSLVCTRCRTGNEWRTGTRTSTARVPSRTFAAAQRTVPAQSDRTTPCAPSTEHLIIRSQSGTPDRTPRKWPCGYARCKGCQCPILRPGYQPKDAASSGHLAGGASRAPRPCEAAGDPFRWQRLRHVRFGVDQGAPMSQQRRRHCGIESFRCCLA